ncbi:MULTISPECIES: DUF2158 domain-containing protein [Acinetobacter]|uniref:DUF2158 domain-containing protein n=1 Tax=Acinetobacter TaxID=469 RepID=UPI0018EB0B39|nr:MULTISPECIES: DUF2158 domain-containing protein [Acinetobacter]MBJ6351087.1 DUF2158 domain-containing protein [Acinetobacter sp. c1]MBM0956713.1 DUF2158 domain-containing protein [Acinetobacter sp. C13]MDV7705025.1 DUF2158 domain-containing protein [Acinetobacter pittii]MDV7760365.1 DUF2158 domain-containing protein [Acinetobacter pittii]
MTTARTPKYKIGDKVKLNVNGPDMAVKSISLDYHKNFEGIYRCQWFAGKKLEWGEFPEESLELVTSEDEDQEKK